MMDFFSWLLPQLSTTQWAVHLAILSVNLLLLFLAKPILNLFSSYRNNLTTLRIFQALNILILVLLIVDLALTRISASYETSFKYENHFINLGISLGLVYTALFSYNILCYLSRKRFGVEREIDNKKVFLDTYSSRLIDLVSLFVISLITIYILIKIWGADSMLEATGIFGIIAGFLAFTSGSWAPDILGGLIILNTQILEDGDVVLIEDFPDEYVISKVTLFYVVLYDITNNHRTLIRNNRFISSKIDNLSRVASSDGVRQALKYKVSYPNFSNSSADKRKEKLNCFKNRIDHIFDRAFELCREKKDIKINHNRPFEWALTNTGDYALEYTLWVYLERIPKTKITSTLRKHFMGTIYAINEEVYTSAVIEDIDLSTPILNDITLEKVS